MENVPSEVEPLRNVLQRENIAEEKGTVLLFVSVVADIFKLIKETNIQMKTEIEQLNKNVSQIKIEIEKVLDRFGRKPVMALVAALILVNTLVLAFAGSVWVFSMCRLLLGFGKRSLAHLDTYIRWRSCTQTKPWEVVLLALILILTVVPETPYFLIAKNRPRHEVAEVLAKLRSYSN
nr:unnamed protein product [Callosobruchus analis]